MPGRKTRTVLLALATLATASSSSAAAVAATSDWTYWKTELDQADLLGCSTEVAKVWPNGNVAGYYLHRAPSDSSCIRAANGAQVEALPTGPGEVVLFKQDAVADDDTRLTMAESWADRALTTLLQTSKAEAKMDTQTQLGGQRAFLLESDPWTGPIGLKSISVDANTIVLAMDEQALSTIDQRTTFDTRLRRLSFHPTSTLFASPHLQNDKKPEPSFKRPRHNSHIAKLASPNSAAFNHTRMLRDVRILTGEAAQPKEIGEWHTRHSATHGARLAAEWIKQQLEESLAPLAGSGCSYFEYSPYFAPNVVCEIPVSSGSAGAEKDKGGAVGKGTVIVSAHYDSRGTFGSTTAPGANDDGSGIAALLSIARALGTSDVTFSSPVQLVAFSGEEQGLVGSSKYASHLASLSPAFDVKLALQMDMLAYRKPGEPMQLAFPNQLATKSATAHVWAIADIYTPELHQGYTPVCCSDHQSFWHNNFPATWVFERAGPIADPMYHNSADLSQRDGYDPQQLAAIARVVTATLLDLAASQL